MKRLTLSYVAGYLFFGGIGLVLAPGFALELLQSNGDYGDIMPRIVGALMIGLGGFVVQFVYREDYSYYSYSVYIRSFFILFFFFLYFFRSQDPFLLVLSTIILLGLLPSVYTLVTERSARNSRP